MNNNLNLEILNSINYPIIKIDIDSNILWTNKKFQVLCKKENLNSILSESPVKDGMIMKIGGNFYEIKLSSNIDKEKNSILSFFNIEKRKNLEEKVLNKQKIFESLSENLPLGIVSFSDSIVYTNTTFEKMLNISKKELKMKSFFDLLDEKNKSIFNSNIEQIINLKKLSIESNLQIVKKNQKSIWVNITTRLVKEKEGILFINVIKDISEEKKKYDELERLASYDRLTNLYNRHKFDELINIEYKIVKRYNRDLSGIFFDIDHFKKVNDNFGHDVGDYVLKTVASLIQNNIRETDVFARWGGEEFIILLMETNIEKAFEIAEKIRIVIQDYKFEKVDSIRISLGISQLKNERISTFLKRLDVALYNSKNNGRNTSTIL